jgi:hypothetical protein
MVVLGVVVAAPVLVAWEPSLNSSTVPGGIRCKTNPAVAVLPLAVHAAGVFAQVSE